MNNSVYLRETYYLGPVKIEPGLRRVTNASGLTTTLSGPKILALACLAERHGDTVTRNELSKILSGVASGFRDTSALSQHIKEIRQALGDNARSPTFIGTIRSSRNSNWETTQEGGFTLLVQPTFEAPLVWDKDPYLGLRTFEFDHHKVFFGRAAAVNQITGYLRQRAAEGCAFILVHGVSGAGKSSVVRAGVVPALCQSATRISDEWRHAVFRVRAGAGDLFDDLAEALVSACPEVLETIRSVRFIAAKLRNKPQAADKILSAVLKQEPKHGLETKSRSSASSFALIVDQMEELFTRKPVHDQRSDKLTSVYNEFSNSLKGVELDSFLLALDALARSGWCYVIGTIRSDFLNHALRNKVLAKMAGGTGVYTLIPPTAGELRSIIRGPLKLCNLSMEEAGAENSLSDIILQDALPNLDSLAVLGFTLSELYKRRTGDGVLTIQAYRDLGGLHGCIARRAEEVLRSMPYEAQASLNSVLTRLASIDPENEYTPIARAAEWGVIAENPNCIQLIEAFRDAHLFYMDRSRGGSRVVRVAHEAVITTWERARKWISDNRYLLLVHAKVARRASEWTTYDRDPSLLLYSGLSLSEATMLVETDTQLTAEEEDFIALSILAESERQKSKQRQSKIFAVVAVVFFLFFALATFLGLYAYGKAQQIKLEKEKAESVLEFMVDSFEQAMPHETNGELVTARDLLDKNAARIFADQSMPGDEKAALLSAIGRSYSSLGEGQLAIKMLEQSLSIQRKMVAPDPSLLSRTLAGLGRALVLYGDSPESLDSHVSTNVRSAAMLTEAIEILKSSAPEERLEIAWIMNNLALILKDRGSYSEAGRLLKRSLEIQTELLGSDSPKLAITRANIGSVLTAQGRVEEAEPFFRTALAIGRQIYKPSDPKLANLINQFAGGLMSSEKYEEAVPLYAEALAMRLNIYGKKHRLIGVSKNNLGKALLKMGPDHINEAVKLFEQAIANAYETLGDQHRYVAFYQTSLSQALILNEKFQEAEAAARSAIQILEKNKEEVAIWRIAVAEYSLGEALALQGDCDSARLYISKSMKGLKRAQGPSSSHALEATRRWRKYFVEGVCQ